MGAVYYEGTEFVVAIPGKTRNEYFKEIAKWYGKSDGFTVGAGSGGLTIRFEKFLTPAQKDEVMNVLKQINYSR